MNFYVSRARAMLQIRASFPHDPDTAESRARSFLSDAPEVFILHDLRLVNVILLERAVTHSLIPETPITVG
jgi:hypothetical protein